MFRVIPHFAIEILQQTCRLLQKMIWWVIVTILVLFFIIKQFVLDKLLISDIHNTYTFVTGCDTGFGHLLVLKLIKNGIPTFAACLTEKGKVELQLKASKFAGKLWTVSLDVTDADSVNGAKCFVQQQLKDRGLWGLVCNAGIASINAPDDWLNVEDYKAIAEVNTFGVIRTCQAFKPLIKKTKGRIIIMTAGMARLALPGVGPYTVSKFAVGAYADILRLECKHFGYTVHIIEPGFFKTNIVNTEAIIRGFDNLWNRLSEETKKEYGETFYYKAKEAVASSLPRISSGNVDMVIDAYVHALTSRFPYSRYKVGYDMKFVFAPLTFVPTFLQDVIVGFFMKTQNAPVPDACLTK